MDQRYAPTTTEEDRCPSISQLHLGLSVRDHERSVRFSATWFGFDPDGARRHSNATVILRNPDGVDLALHRDPAPEQPAFVHVGFQLLEAEAVRELLAGREVGRCQSRSAGTSRAT